MSTVIKIDDYAISPARLCKGFKIDVIRRGGGYDVTFRHRRNGFVFIRYDDVNPKVGMIPKVSETFKVEDKLGNYVTVGLHKLCNPDEFIDILIAAHDECEKGDMDIKDDEGFCILTRTNGYARCRIGGNKQLPSYMDKNDPQVDLTYYGKCNDQRVVAIQSVCSVLWDVMEISHHAKHNFNYSYTTRSSAANDIPRFGVKLMPIYAVMSEFGLDRVTQESAYRLIANLFTDVKDQVNGWNWED